MDATALTDALKALWQAQDHPALPAALARWPQLPYRPSGIAPQSLPVLDRLPRRSEDFPDLVAGLHALRDRLYWGQTYTEDDFGPAFLANYGWTILLGGSGAFESPDLIAAFLLLGPGIEYPNHRHEPEEFYLVLSGRASWRQGDGDWRVLGPGALIHNPPWEPHAMRTDQGEALLAANLTLAGRHGKSATD